MSAHRHPRIHPRVRMDYCPDTSAGTSLLVNSNRARFVERDSRLVMDSCNPCVPPGRRHRPGVRTGGVALKPATPVGAIAVRQNGSCGTAEHRNRAVRRERARQTHYTASAGSVIRDKDTVSRIRIPDGRHDPVEARNHTRADLRRCRVRRSGGSTPTDRPHHPGKVAFGAHAEETTNTQVRGSEPHPESRQGRKSPIANRDLRSPHSFQVVLYTEIVTSLRTTHREFMLFKGSKD